MFETAHEVLRTYKKFALLGASQDPGRFGHEVFEAFHTRGFEIQPINPKYLPVIHQWRRYPNVPRSSSLRWDRL
jgi:predicted CoA-binding protein